MTHVITSYSIHYTKLYEPWLGNKTSDPAVVVIDDCGMNVISLLSGHIGGANNLCNTIALIIGANPVITTSSDISYNFV